MTTGTVQRVTNTVLIALAVASVIAVLATSQSVTTSELERRENNLFAAWRDDDVTLVKIERGDGEVVLERSALDDAGLGDWMITAPVKEEADVAAVHGFLSTLELATWARPISSGEVDRARFGLDAPRWVVRVRMGTIGYRLRIGSEAPTPPGSVYVEVDGDGVPRPAVGIVSKTLAAELDANAATFRERLLMPYLSSSLDRLILEGRGGTRRLKRAEWGGWRFDAMAADRRVNREALDRILLQFARTRAEHFVERSVATKAMAGAATVKVTMVPSGGRPRGVVEVGGTCPDAAEDVIAIRSEPDPVAACVPKSVMEGLATTESELVDASLFTLRRDEVEAWSAVYGDRTLEVARKEAGYVLRKPRDAEIEEDAGNKRLFEMVTARGRLVDVGDLATVGLDAPAGRVELTSVAESDEKVRREVIAVGREGKDGSVHVRREHDGAVLLVSRDVARALGPDAALVRSTRVLAVEASDVRDVRVEYGEVRQHLERNASGSFTLHEPPGFSVDNGLAADLLDTVSNVRAERWVADRDDGTFGLTRPSGKVTVRVTSGDASAVERVLVLGDVAPGGVYASIDGDPGVFVLGRLATDRLRAWLVDRSAFIVDPSETVRIELRRQGSSLRLEKDGAGFSVAAGDVSVTPGKVREIVDLLTALRADGTVHVGAARPHEGLAEPVLTVRVLRAEGLGDRSTPVEWFVGSGDAWEGASVYYARRRGVDATFALARSQVLALLAAF